MRNTLILMIVSLSILPLELRAQNLDPVVKCEKPDGSAYYQQGACNKGDKLQNAWRVDPDTPAQKQATLEYRARRQQSSESQPRTVYYSTRPQQQTEGQRRRERCLKERDDAAQWRMENRRASVSQLRALDERVKRACTGVSMP